MTNDNDTLNTGPLRGPIKTSTGIAVVNAVLRVIWVVASASAQAHSKPEWARPTSLLRLARRWPLRRGARSEATTGVHDPCEARALVIDNGARETRVCCGGSSRLRTTEWLKRIRAIAPKQPNLSRSYFVMSSHTHSGGGAFMEMLPPVAMILAGKFDPKVRGFYEQRTAEAIIAADKNLTPARIAFGAGEARGISRFRSAWPPNGPIDPEVGVIRVDRPSFGKPWLFVNFAAKRQCSSGEINFICGYVG